MNILIPLLLLLSNNMYGQKRIYVVDSISKQPLKFARINFGEYGKYTNEKGYFILNNSEQPKKLSITFLGYKTEYIHKNKIKDTIFLKRSFINLNEIILSNKRKEIKVGLPHINRFTFGSFPLQKSQEIVSSLKPKDSKFKGFLKNIILHFSKITFNKKIYKKTSYAIIRINIYQIDSLERNIEKIFSSIPIKINKLKKNKLKINLENKKIFLGKKGLAIGIEYIGHIDDKGNLITNSSLLVRPSLTDDENLIFEQKTFLRSSITEAIILPSVSKYLTKQMHNKKIYTRNLAIGLTVN